MLVQAGSVGHQLAAGGGDYVQGGAGNATKAGYTSLQGALVGLTGQSQTAPDWG